MLRCLHQLAYDIQIYVMSTTDEFTGTANTSVVCCLYSYFHLKLVKIMRYFFLFKFEVAHPSPTMNSRSMGPW